RAGHGARDAAEGAGTGAGAERPVDVESRRSRRAIGPGNLNLVGGGRQGGADSRRSGRRADGVRQLRGPDLLTAVAPAVGPGREELAGDARQAVVIAELVSVIRPGDRLVRLGRGHLD